MLDHNHTLHKPLSPPSIIRIPNPKSRHYWIVFGPFHYFDWIRYANVVIVVAIQVVVVVGGMIQVGMWIGRSGGRDRMSMDGWIS